MKRVGLLAVVLLGCALWPSAASAQCVRFSKEAPCEVRSGPFAHLDFGAGRQPDRKAPNSKGSQVVAPAKPEPSHAIDCAMIEKPDAQFHSNMPIVTPDPKIKDSLRVIVVPPCKSS
jgi:hypothetical protein